MPRGFKTTSFGITEAQLLSISVFALLFCAIITSFMSQKHDTLQWSSSLGMPLTGGPQQASSHPLVQLDARAAALSRQNVYSPPLSKGPNPPPQARFTPPPPPQLELMPERLSCPAVLDPRGLSLWCLFGEVFYCGAQEESLSLRCLIGEVTL